MDKNAIKKFATWARRELISRVSQKAEFYGVTAKGYGDFNADSIDGRVLSRIEKSQRQALINHVRSEGFEHAIDEVAYTWFNRFSALRYMEVNNYLPTRVRIFTNENGEFKPQIIDEAIHLELDGLDMEKVYSLKEANETEALYRYLLITQCNALSKIMPVMFQKIDDYTELLLPDYLLREGSVIEQMVTSIPEENWREQIEIIGWLYQYYISEKHDQIVNINKGTVQKDDVPAATQLFTTDWVVRYMVDNSLGRYWIERHPESNLADKLTFFVKSKNGEVPYIDEKVEPQDLTFFDVLLARLIQENREKTVCNRHFRRFFSDFKRKIGHTGGEQPLLNRKQHSCINILGNDRKCYRCRVLFNVVGYVQNKDKKQGAEKYISAPCVCVEV